MTHDQLCAGQVGSLALALALALWVMSLTPSLGTIHSNIPLKIKFAVQISNAILHAAVGKKQTHDWVLLQGIWITSTPIKPLLAANSDPYHSINHLQNQLSLYQRIHH